MYLSIIFRSHDGGSVHSNKRFVNDSKSEILLNCLGSLIESINEFDMVKETKLTIIDDHSSEETYADILDKLMDCKCDHEIEIGRAHV